MFGPEIIAVLSRGYTLANLTADALAGLTVETALLTPAAAAYLLLLAAHGAGAAAQDAVVAHVLDPVDRQGQIKTHDPAGVSAGIV